MEEQATQELTQPFTDPRRLGEPSITDQDMSDILCVLHPTSPSAYKAVEIVAETAPQHIFQNNGLSYILEEGGNGPGVGNEQDQASNSQANPEHEANDLPPAPTSGSSAQDIALRFSSRVHDVCLGWSFGKSPKKADLLICDRSQAHIISAMHFRIYVIEGGVTMLEDHSMNGTWVDTVFLSKKAHETNPNCPVRRMLSPGSEIRVMIAEDQKVGLRFHVAFPKHEHLYHKWHSKLLQYLGYVAQMKRQREAAAVMAVTGLAMPPPVSCSIQFVSMRFDQLY